jgi:Bacteriophage Sf6, terminase small subunit-like
VRVCDTAGIASGGFVGKIGNDRIARFLELIDCEQKTLEELCQRITDGQTLAAACIDWGVPYGRFAAWLDEDRGRTEVYERAKRIRADELVAKTLVVSAGEPPRIEEFAFKDGRTVPVVINPETARDKLRVDTLFRVAAKWDRERFGDGEGRAAPVPNRQVPLLEAARRLAFVIRAGAEAADKVRRAPVLIEQQRVEEPPETAAPVVEDAAEDDGGWDI